jgi:hypothetical protein
MLLLSILSNPQAHVTNTAFAQAWLGFGSRPLFEPERSQTDFIFPHKQFVATSITRGAHLQIND